jgi:hypothetical protein
MAIDRIANTPCPLVQPWVVLGVKAVEAHQSGFPGHLLLLEFKDLVDQGLLQLPAPRKLKEINPKG